MDTLSIQRPRPFIDIRTPASFSTSVNRGEVNWLLQSDVGDLPQSLTEQGFLGAVGAENTTPMVFEICQASSLRAAQTITDARV